MSRTRKGGFKKNGDFVEVTVGANDSYQDVISKSCDGLGISADRETEIAVLLRMSGSRILDLPIDNGLKVTPWTMLGYTENVLSKSTKVKFGIAFVEVCNDLSDCKCLITHSWCSLGPRSPCFCLVWI